MKKSILAIVAAIALASSPVAFANESGDSENNSMGASNGASAQIRNIDKCINANSGTVKTYDMQSHVKPCTLIGDEYSGKPVPEQKFKTPFR